MDMVCPCPVVQNATWNRFVLIQIVPTFQIQGILLLFFWGNCFSNHFGLGFLMGLRLGWGGGIFLKKIYLTIFGG